MQIREIPLAQIRRPLPRSTDPEKVAQLMQSIAELGLLEPIDVLENDPHISVVAKQIKNSRPLGQVRNPAYTEVQAQNVWGKAVNSIVTQKKTPQEATEQAIAEIKTIFSNWSKV
jgi:ABC-type glycerol-3-phosphate transport system substrate-binding protein